MKISTEDMEDLKNNQPLRFSQALDLMMNKTKVTRVAWNGVFQFVELQKPEENSKMKRAYFFITPKDGQPVPYGFSNLDILSDDWLIV